MTGVRPRHPTVRALRRALLALALLGAAACNGSSFSPDTFEVLGSQVNRGAGRAFHAAVIGPADSDVHLIGGQDADGTPLTSDQFAERFDWSLRVFDPEPLFSSATGRVDPVTGVSGAEILAVGGQVSGVPGGAGGPEYLPMGPFAQDGGETYEVTTQTGGAFTFAGGAANGALVQDQSGDLFLIGGRDASNNLRGDILRWDAGTFAPTGASLITAREGHTATLLAGGEILVVGGWNTGTPLASAELIDPTTTPPTVTTTSGSPVFPRAEHTATASADGGRVLIYGGFTAVNTVAGTTNTDAAAEVYDVATDTFSSLVTTPAPTPRVYHTATRLANGDVLILGGVTDNSGTVSDTAQVFRFSGTGVLRDVAGTLAFPRFGHTATLMPDSTVLVAGGLSSPGSLVPEAERYLPEVL